MPRVICLAGPAGADKKKLLLELIKELSVRGLKIGLIAEDSANSPNLEPGDAEAVVRISPHNIGVWRADASPLNIEQIVQRFMPEPDMVISEAYQGEARPKIEFVPKGADPSLLGDSGLKAFVSQDNLESDKPVFTPQDVKGLADFILEKFSPKDSPPRMRVLIEGKPVPLNDFVQGFVGDTIRALLGSLRGGDRPGRMEIFLD